MSIPRPCERQCRTCGYWKHHSRFRSKSGKGSLSTKFASDCRDCETKHRNAEKNKDRALHIMKERARDHAAKHGVSFDFMWINMNWQSLVPIYRALLTDEASCTCCGHRFDHERDIQIEHNNPPRFAGDFARLHARNISFACASCNRTKSDAAYDEWLDRQEQARLSNEDNPSPSLVREPNPGPLFDWRPPNR